MYILFGDCLMFRSHQVLFKYLGSGKERERGWRPWIQQPLWGGSAVCASTEAGYLPGSLPSLGFPPGNRPPAGGSGRNCTCSRGSTLPPVPSASCRWRRERLSGHRETDTVQHVPRLGWRELASSRCPLERLDWLLLDG